VSTPPRAEQIRQVFAARRPIDLDTTYFEAGFTSPMLVGVLDGLRELGLELDLIDLYRFPTVRLLAADLGSPAPDTRAPASPSRLPWSR
jgi:hypothetical protein